MHPQRNQVLGELIRQVTGDDLFRADIAAVDGCWEIRRFLARVAQESSEADWSAEAVQIIRRARSDLARSHQENLRLVVATDWSASNRLIIEILLGLLATEPGQERALRQADTVARLAVTPEDRARARDALLALIAADNADSGRILGLPRAVAMLAVTDEDVGRLREVLLDVLAEETEYTYAWVLADIAAQLHPAPGDLARVREVLLDLLTDRTDDFGMAPKLVETVARLDPTAGDLARAREALLDLLADQTRPHWGAKLADALAQLDPTAEDRASAREALLKPPVNWMNVGLADGVVRLAVTAEERARAREALLGFLDGAPDPQVARALADTVAQLDPTAEDLAKPGRRCLECSPTPHTAGGAWGLTDCRLRSPGSRQRPRTGRRPERPSLACSPTRLTSGGSRR